MRVGIIGPQGPDLFAENLVETLGVMGHDAIALGPALRGRHTKVGKVAADVVAKMTKVEYRLQKHVLKAIPSDGLDLVITVDASLLPPVVSALKERADKVVLWFPDSVANLGRSLMFAGPYDALFFKEPHLIDRARALLEIPVHYLPQACNPIWHRPPEVDVHHEALVVAGTLYPWRVNLLERVVNAGIPLRIFGPPLPRWLSSPLLEPLHMRRYIAREEKAIEFRSSSAVLNTLHPSEILGSNSRLFEAAGCGAVVITEHRPEVDSYFVADAEILTYTTFSELVEAARFVLASPDEARKIGDAAADRAHRDHTMEIRLRQMFDLLELDA